MQQKQNVTTQLRCLVAVSATFAFSGCNTRTPILDNPVIATAPTSVAGPAITGPRTPRMIELAPAGTMGGGSGRGTVFLNFPAPDGGLTVSLRSLHPSVAVQPSAITVPGGGLSASFSYTTQMVSNDTTVDILASTAEGSNVARLGVWAVLPTFFSYSVDKGSMIGFAIADRELAERYTPENARFTVSCQDGMVRTIVAPLPLTGAGWFVNFGPPRRSPPVLPFTPGFYPAGTVQPPSGNRMQVELNPATGCTSGGHFTVHEAQFTTEGRVARFWATFERTCAGRPGATRGDLRITNPETVSPGCAALKP